MKVDIAFRHLPQSDALKGRVQTRLDKLDRYFSRPVEAHVVLSTEKHRHRAEFSLSAPQTVLTSDSETDDLYRAIDDAADALERQVKKYRNRLSDHHVQARQVAELRPQPETV